jgi:hypothetical protein
MATATLLLMRNNKTPVSHQSHGHRRLSVPPVMPYVRRGVLYLFPHAAATKSVNATDPRNKDARRGHWQPSRGTGSSSEDRCTANSTASAMHERHPGGGLCAVRAASPFPMRNHQHGPLSLPPPNSNPQLLLLSSSIRSLLLLLRRLLPFLSSLELLSSMPP